VIFLAVLGAGAGFSLGTLTKGAHNTPAAGPSTTEPAGNQPTGPGTAPSSAGAGNNDNTGNTGGDSNSTQCPRHTVDLARDGALSLVLYLRTAKSEVWICKAADGTLFYQGHSGSPHQELVEHVSALYLDKVTTEEDGYVATNTDKDNGHVTKYHVNPQRLIIEYVWDQSKKDVQPAV
jgi:hypothetical protein